MQQTGIKQIKMWSTQLLAEVDSVKLECPKRALDGLVMYKRDGGTLTRRTFNVRWIKAVRMAEAEPVRELDFTFHDIKAKGISDYKGAAEISSFFPVTRPNHKCWLTTKRLKFLRLWETIFQIVFQENIPGNSKCDGGR